MPYKTSLIRKPRPGEDKLRHADGNTQDIINTVLWADKFAAWYTQQFATQLQAASLKQTCRNIWAFVKEEIPYKVDPLGKQYIKSPGRLWEEKQGDCKSFSLFTASCLKNLGIPYGYRFASYSSEATPTHVYVYVPLKNGGEIILDSVWKGPFNTEKTFTHKRDYLMSEVHYLGATTMPAQQQRKVYNAFLNTGTAMVAGRITAPIYRPAPGIDPTVLKINVPMEQLSEGELDLLLARQRLEIEKRNSIAIAGPENYQVKKYNAAIGTIDYCISKIDNPDAIIALGEAMIQKGDNAVIGGFFKKIGRALKKGFKAIGKGVQKAANAVAKVVTFPLRLIAKGIMEIYLPKAAPAFLYLFAPEASLPDKMKRKRKKAEKFKRFVTKKIGMKEKHFMGIVRNALTKKYHKSPESFLAEAIKNSAIKGIGSPYFHARVNLQRIGELPEHFNFSPETVGPLLKSSGKGKKIFNAANKVLNVAQGAANFVPGLGPVVSAVIKAIQWIVQKLGGGKDEQMTAQDMPDLQGDLGNSIDYGQLNQDYGNVNTGDLSETATELINNNANYGQAQQVFQNQYPQMSQQQVDELATQTQNGYTPITEDEAGQFAWDIKNQHQNMTEESIENSGGGVKPGLCKC